MKTDKSYLCKVEDCDGLVCTDKGKYCKRCYCVSCTKSKCPGAMVV